MQPACSTLIGATGMLGSELARAWLRRDWPVTALADERAIDITDAEVVRGAIARNRPDLVLNAAAYTDVDGAEANEPAAQRVNGDGPANLAQACRESGAILVHFSTDYIFDGRADAPYPVDHPAAPKCAYGRTKLAGEEAIRGSGCEYLIVRTSWLFAAHSKNFVRSILHLAGERDTLRVVDDQRGRPTYCPDLAALTAALIEAVESERLPRPVRRTLHATNDGECTWHELARTIVRRAGLDCDVQPCTSEEFPRPARRPAYSVLDIDETAAIIGQRPRPWPEALQECLEALGVTDRGSGVRG